MESRNQIALLFFILLLPFAAFGQIYEWVDEKGVKHYSNEPPPEGIEVYTQKDEIQTDEAQVAEQEEAESDQPDLQEKEPPVSESEAPPEQAESPAAEAPPPDTVVVEDEEREAFHRERIKQRTRQNTSPAPSLQIEESGAARQNPRVERKQNLPE